MMRTSTRTKPRTVLMNRAMAMKLARGEAIDVSARPKRAIEIVVGRAFRTIDAYELDQVVDGKDYCDAVLEAWVWSIGRRKRDGKIFASLSSALYQHPDFECLWLR